MDSAYRYGIDTPAGLTGCTFGDTLLATAIYPEHTTIRPPVANRSDKAVTMLAGLIRRSKEGPVPEVPHRQLEFELIRRLSDAPPRPGRR